MPARIDLTGKRYGSLVVLNECAEPYRSPSGKRARKWLCRCDCGAELEIVQNALTGKRPPQSCSTCARRRIGREQGQTNNLRRGAPAAKASPNSGRFETNVNGKHFVLRSPDGRLFEFDNLAHFLREHRSEFPNEVSAATSFGSYGHYRDWYVVHKSERKYKARKQGNRE